MSYTPDCADCPTPDDCKVKNDCQVLRQIRHGRERTPAEIGRAIADKLSNTPIQRFRKRPVVIETVQEAA